MADVYNKAIRSKLVLKGGVKLSKGKKTKKSKKRRIHESQSEDEEAFELKKLRGSGRIITSGTTVMGKDGTKFLSELSNGDAIMIQHPKTFQEETRIVNMVLSDVSISISSGFSSDLISTTTYHYIKAPPAAAGTSDSVEEKKLEKKRTAEVKAFGTYAGGTAAGSEYTYRVRKQSAYGGYKIVKGVSDTTNTREDLLDKRIKMKGDRYC